MRQFSLRLLRLFPLCLLLFAFPATAHAHSTVKGMGDFVSGLFHPLTTPTHVLIIVGLGLLAGRGTSPNLKIPMAVFMPLSALALVLTTAGWIRAVYPPVLICIALCAGTLLALEKTPHRLAFGALFAAAALAMGFDSAVEASSTSTVVKTLLGNWISLSALIADIAIYVSLGKDAKWLKIALRIAGSWIIAISLLVLAFSLRR
jgi:urease accessory protein